MTLLARLRFRSGASSSSASASTLTLWLRLPAQCSSVGVLLVEHVKRNLDLLFERPPIEWAKLPVCFWSASRCAPSPSD